MKKPKMIPHNTEAEQSVLSCVLIDDNAAFQIMESLQKEDFYSEIHQNIFDAMLQLFVQQTPIDLLTLTDLLEQRNAVEKCGGMDSLVSLPTMVPSAANFASYVEIVRKHAQMRRLIHASEKIIEEAYESENVESTLNRAESAIYGIASKEDKSALTRIDRITVDVINQLQELQKNKGTAQGLGIPFPKLNRLLNGLHRSDLVLIAARPAVGKTAFVLNVAQHCATQGKAKVAIFSLEMPKEQLVQRMLCSLAGVSMEKAKRGELSLNDWKNLWEANQQLSASDLYIDDSSLTTYADIRSKCRRIKRELGGLDLVTIDYLQLMSGLSNKKNENRQNEISEISRNLKIIARELDVPLLVLSQLSRSVEARTDHRPILSDLRESGAIEQDADIVMFLFKPDQYANLQAEKDAVELIVAKHRNGATGVINMKWFGESVTFKEVLDVEPGGYMPPPPKEAPPEPPVVSEIPMDGDLPF